MHRLDMLRLSLLASLTGCAVESEAGDSDGQTTTTMGSGSSGGSETGIGATETGTSETGTETGTETETGDEVCGSDCVDPVEIADGIVRCADGRINRISGGTFDPTIDAPGCAGTEQLIYCSSDAECSGPNAKCISDMVYVDDTPNPSTVCTCVNSCASDSDCNPGAVCMPPNVLPGSRDWPSCIWASCTAGSDCAECGECGLGAHENGCSWNQTASCRTPDDLCSINGTCEGDYCFPFDGTLWSCGYEFCGAGRPLLVGAQPCTAPPRQRTEWATLVSQLDELGPDSQLAAHWAELAALEHASVASFARFGMQLLALGAPPRLLRACKCAALDEIEHAQLAYSLASAYGRTPIGPGHLNLRGVAITASWREVVSSLIIEACVGETLASAEAMTAAEQARAPAVRAVLERIAADELRHAQLAWQSLAWLLELAGEPDRAWAHALLERSIVAAGAARSESLDRPADGVLGGQRREQLHRDASARVLAPLARALDRHCASATR
jgi:hypothetical protein